MGGDYYDRSMVDSSDTSGTMSNTQVTFQTDIHKSCDPKRWCDEKLEVNALNPIVFALDVTGSMGEWTQIIYDKMPMFYGQIMMQKYLTDPCISFCAIGDAHYDKAPLQCTEFGRGSEIDQLISKIFLERGGGPNTEESYEYGAYFYDQKVSLINQEIPFYFFTGDEFFFETFNDDDFKKVFGMTYSHTNIDKNQKEIGSSFYKCLMKKYNVFGVKKEYHVDSRSQWVKAIGKERVLDIKTPKACIDIILGAIALTSGTRTLEEYVKDLNTRGQSDERVKEVVAALTPYSDALKSKLIVPVIRKNKSMDEIVTKIHEERLQKFGDKAILFDKVEQKMGSNFPKEFKCPFSKKIMMDPIVCSDGETFDRISIENWLKEGKLENPINGQTIDADLTENTLLKKMIYDYCEKNQ